MVQGDLQNKQRIEQIAFEEESDNKAFNELFSKRLEDLKTRGDEDSLVSGLIREAYEDVRTNLEEAFAKESNSQYVNINKAVGGDKVAALALTLMFRVLLKDEEVSFQNLSTTLGKAIVLESMIDQANHISPLYMRRVFEGIDRKAVRSSKHLEGVYRSALNQVSGDSIRYSLKSADYIHIGKYSLDALWKAGLLDMSRRCVHGKEVVRYALQEDVLSYITSENNFKRFFKFSPSSRYMLAPPDDWVSQHGGGYLSEYRKNRHGLMILNHKVSKETRLEVLKTFTAENYPLVFEAGNYIQSIPYVVDERVVELVKEVWQKDYGIFGIPKRTYPEYAPFPFKEGWKKEDATEEELKVFSAWNRGKSDWYTDKKKHASQVYQTYSILNSVPTGRAMWFPVACDTRGRWYYSATVSPQGDDMQKAMLQFYEKKPLGKRGLYWLKVHLATSLGVDDIRFDLRVAHVDAIWDGILRALDNPVDMHESFGDEAPLTAYITALEIRNALESGDPESYMCGIPVHMDATVSGTQHFSAMLRDPVGALFTNLQDNGTDKKSDLYTHVANKVLERVRLCEESEYKKFWLEHGISRTMAKQPVMTFNYAVTKITVADYVRMVYNEETGEKIDGKCSFYLADKIFEGVAEAIPSAHHGMEFLKACVREVGDEPITWITPSGFKVYHDRPNTRLKRLNVRSAGVVKVVAREDIEGCNRSEMVSAIAPNFIHSYDAAHLTLTALAMKDKGMVGAFIHDSIGTHPCDVDVFHEVVRDKFVKMYSDVGADVMGDLKRSLGAEVESPLQGDFDLELVRDSEFFFS